MNCVISNVANNNDSINLGGEMKKYIYSTIMIFLIMFGIVSCGNKKNIEDTISIVFLPNESNDSLKAAREEYGRIVEEATGKKVNLITTTDYNIAVENIISGKAQIGYIGAEGLLAILDRTNDVQAVLTNAGASGTLEDALYYSFLAIRTEDEDKYKTNGEFDLDKIKDKRAAFVSNNSTSGFKVPAQVIAEHFKLSDIQEILEPNVVFNKVIFGNSHPGTQVTLFNKQADVAAFAIPKAFTIYRLVEGEESRSGAVYRVLDTAVSPFDEYVGSEFTVLRSIPVLNGPVIFNVRTLSEEDQKKIKEAFLSKSTTDNPYIFSSKESDIRGLFLKENDNVGFVETNNAWYEQLRNIK